MKNKIIAMIPARMGSERLKYKNMALLAGKPLISHVIEKSIQCAKFDKIVINTDWVCLEKIAQKYGIDYYLRPKHLASSQSRSDDVVYDFLLNYDCDILVWVNPISPLQPVEEIINAIDMFQNSNYSTLMTVRKNYVHCVYNDNEVNFDLNNKFDKTQDLDPVCSFVYSLMMWKTDIFLEKYKNDNFAFLIKPVCYYPISIESSIIIKTNDDLRFAEAYLANKSKEIEYSNFVEIT